MIDVSDSLWFAVAAKDPALDHIRGLFAERMRETMLANGRRDLEQQIALHQERLEQADRDYLEQQRSLRQYQEYRMMGRPQWREPWNITES